MSNRRTTCQRCYSIFLCEFHGWDNAPSHSLCHNKHSLWHGGAKSKVHSDVLACHKSNVKCSVWSLWSSCQSALLTTHYPASSCNMFPWGWIEWWRSWWGGGEWPPTVRPLAFTWAGTNRARGQLTSWLHPWVVVCLEWLGAGRAGWQSKLWWGVRRRGWRLGQLGVNHCYA